MSEKQTPTAPVSNLWSCETLEHGIQHVAATSITDDFEDQLLKELQDRLVENKVNIIHGLMTNNLEWSYSLFLHHVFVNISYNIPGLN